MNSAEGGEEGRVAGFRSGTRGIDFLTLSTVENSSLSIVCAVLFRTSLRSVLLSLYTDEYPTHPELNYVCLKKHTFVGNKMKRTYPCLATSHSCGFFHRKLSATIVKDG